MSYLYQVLKKIINKIPYKIWKSYVLKKEVIDLLIKKQTFTLDEIKKYTLHIVEAPNKNSIIAADPFLHDACNLLYESISKRTGYGQIYKYNLINKKHSLLNLPKNSHFSFPRTINIKDKLFLTCESSSTKGLSVFNIDDQISIIKKSSISFSSEDLNYHILDPILDINDRSILLYCTTLEYGNNSLIVFESNSHDLFDFKLIKRFKYSLDINNSNKLRLAGKVDLKNKSYFSSQNHEESYGSSLNLINLNSESMSGTINKSNIINHIKCRDLIGPHTINLTLNSNLVLIDLAEKSWKYFPLKIKQIFLKLYYLLFKSK